MELTSSDNLQVEKEEIVCEAIVRWHKYKPAARREDFIKVDYYSTLANLLIWLVSIKYNSFSGFRDSAIMLG